MGVACAAAAVVGAGVVTALLDNGGTAQPSTLAGSGDAPTNTVFVQPASPAMTMGATATFTTPSNAPQVTEAVPPVKAGG